MPTHPTNVRNAMADTVVDLLDVGSTNDPRIVFETSGDAEVATVDMDGGTAFGAAAAGVATVTSTVDDTNATGGTMDHVVLSDNDNADVILATIGTSGTDFIVSSLVVPGGATVQVTSLTYTAPP